MNIPWDFAFPFVPVFTVDRVSRSTIVDLADPAAALTAGYQLRKQSEYSDFEESPIRLQAVRVILLKCHLQMTCHCAKYAYRSNR